MRWPKQIDRFWASVLKNDSCWLWIGLTNSWGYGRLQWDGKETGAHRISWILHNGIIPVGLSVLHKCDNPPCVNPDHLFLGTHKDNMEDCVSKGRFKSNWKRIYGQKNKASKLTNSDVEKIMALKSKGKTQEHIGNMFSISQSQISRIWSRKRRAHDGS